MAPTVQQVDTVFNCWFSDVEHCLLCVSPFQTAVEVNERLKNLFTVRCFSTLPSLWPISSADLWKDLWMWRVCSGEVSVTMVLLDVHF